MPDVAVDPPVDTIKSTPTIEPAKFHVPTTPVNTPVKAERATRQGVLKGLRAQATTMAEADKENENGSPTNKAGKPVFAKAVEQDTPPVETKPVTAPDKSVVDKLPDKTGSPVPGKTDETKPDAPEKGDKAPNAWKLVEQYKKTVKTYEKETAELRERLATVGETETWKAKAEKAEARAKELAEEIRYVNYQKSDEYLEKYDKPYKDSWNKAVNDLKELTVTLEDGSTRTATAGDLITLSNMPLGEARKTAKEWFGDAADDVMAHRRVLRDMADAANKAVEEAKKHGSEREKQMSETQNEARKQVAKLWTQFNSEDEAKYDFLKQKEGDDEWNSRLTKSKTLVDGAFSANPHDPKLTAEQRAKVVRDHAAVRNRAIAYSVRTLELARSNARVAELEKQLEQYKGAEPGNGNGRPSEQPTGQPVNRMKSSLNKLRTGGYVTKGVI